MYDINRQTAPVSILNQFVKTSQIHNYRTRSVSSDSFYVKFSRTDKMHAFFTRIGAQIWNSIPYSIKILKRSCFRKKINELLLNFLRSEDDYVEVRAVIKSRGPGISPSYYECGPQLHLLENRRKIEPNEIPCCLIPHLLVVFTWQLEILVTTLRSLPSY